MATQGREPLPEVRQIREATAAVPHLLIGGHVSAAGGVHRAIERGAADGFTAIQIFTRNPTQWEPPPIPEGVADRFRAALVDSSIRYCVSHVSYLINMASPDANLRTRSIAAMLDEMDRADRLGLRDVVTHLGAHTGAGETEGLRLLAESLNRIAEARPESTVGIALENTAGQGTALGHVFEHIAAVFDRVEAPERLTACFDTCHAHAAGYDLISEEGYERMWREFEEIVGIDRLCCMHLNDAKRERGSKIDRHEHIGDGKLGEEPFRRIMRSESLQAVPKLVETPQSETRHRVNVARLAGYLTA
jgi:deoxyribonuclease IV